MEGSMFNQGSNKENIPPSTSSKQPVTNPLAPIQSKIKKCRKVPARIPLQDITNLVNSLPAQSSSLLFRSTPLFCPLRPTTFSTVSNPRKRKASQVTDLKHRAISKSLRINFRFIAGNGALEVLWSNKLQQFLHQYSYTPSRSAFLRPKRCDDI